MNEAPGIEKQYKPEEASQAMCFSPKLALLSEIDRRVDSLLLQASSLRTMRQRVEMEKDNTAALIVDLLAILN